MAANSNSNRAVLLTTAYLPPLPYLLACHAAEQIVLEGHEHYQKQSYRNRAEIATALGKLSLVVPVKLPHGHGSPIATVEVDYATPWPRLHLGALQAAYAKTPYYAHYIGGLEAIIRSRHTLLLELNAQLLQYLLQAFGLQRPVGYTEGYEPTPPQGYTDLRNAFHPKHPALPGPSYYQPFAERVGFIPNLTAVDLLFNEGPHALPYMLQADE